ncbi:MAG TPA: hypothetical protein PLV92_12765, partial [Pirellulaceae bacterium]|nr:hypothetical protein [Pirellulaceae bacterium]
MSTLLLVTIFLPLAGALALSLVASKGRNAVRAVALLVTLVTLAAAGFLVSEFPADGVGEYAVTEVPWISPDAAGSSGQAGGSLASWVPDIRFSVGLDGLGVWLFGLSALLMVTAVLVSWEAITERPALFYAMLLILESGCLGVFAARDLLLFYI